jgi:hypothetical protein
MPASDPTIAWIDKVPYRLRALETLSLSERLALDRALAAVTPLLRQLRGVGLSPAEEFRATRLLREIALIVLPAPEHLVKRLSAQQVLLIASYYVRLFMSRSYADDIEPPMTTRSRK